MSYIDLKRFGKNVRAIRQKRGWTQEKLAAQAEIHPVYVSYIEKGVRNPSIVKVLSIIRALGCKPSEVFQDIL